MKKVITANIGGYCFTIEEDAYARLSRYLESFKATIADKREADEVMEDIEQRIAEIFKEQVTGMQQVVDTILVGKVIAVLGMPEGNAPYTEKEMPEPAAFKKTRRLFRDPDNIVFGGVCSGLAAYFGIDKVLVRLLFFAAFFLGSFGFWVYIILWIVTPKANTVAEKLEMHGEPVTVENIWNYTKKYSKR
ncbi:MAG: PspC domain-containing protein [Prevotellaceae bacterium]|jgi:phage shock protein PspC (stress-responsive transcriptional regulator)|nr:PspC domain-containing protein [Prevotellaceae bacterium]